MTVLFQNLYFIKMIIKLFLINWLHSYENVLQQFQLLIEKMFKALRKNGKIIALLGNMLNLHTQVDQKV